MTGSPLNEVLLKTVASIYGIAFPRLTSSVAAEAAAAAAALRGGVMAAHFSGDCANSPAASMWLGSGLFGWHSPCACCADAELAKLAADNCVPIVAQMILLAADDGSGIGTALAMPLLPVSAVLEAIQRLPGPKHHLWRDVRMPGCTPSVACCMMATLQLAGCHVRRNFV